MTTKNIKLLRQFILAMLPLLVSGWEGEIRAQPKDIVEGAKKEGSWFSTRVFRSQTLRQSYWHSKKNIRLSRRHSTERQVPP
jgi:hypothetical protein